MQNFWWREEGQHHLADQRIQPFDWLAPFVVFLGVGWIEMIKSPVVGKFDEDALRSHVRQHVSAIEGPVVCHFL